MTGRYTHEREAEERGTASRRRQRGRINHDTIVPPDPVPDRKSRPLLCDWWERLVRSSLSLAIQHIAAIARIWKRGWNTLIASQMCLWARYRVTWRRQAIIAIKRNREWPHSHACDLTYFHFLNSKKEILRNTF